MKMLTLEICTGTSCYMLGSQDLLDTIEGLPPGKRAKINLLEVACFHECGKGPNVKLNGTLESGMTPERLVSLIDRHLR